MSVTTLTDLAFIKVMDRLPVQPETLEWLKGEILPRNIHDRIYCHLLCQLSKRGFVGNKLMVFLICHNFGN